MNKYYYNFKQVFKTLINILKKMSSKIAIECPICYDEIEELKNCVTTECGHQFHCKCLMQNSAINGFSCPMCRSTMATEEHDDEELSEYEDYEEYEQFDDNALTSFRMFHQQLSGEEVEEDQDQEEVEVEEVEEPIIKPSAATIAEILVAQCFTMEDMVKCLLIDHEEYESESDTNERLSDRMFGKFRQIISNYPREQRALEQQLNLMPNQSQLPRQRQGQDQGIRHPSVRLRIHNSFVNLQNRYGILENDDDEEV